MIHLDVNLKSTCLSNNKSLDWTELKACANNTVTITKVIIFLYNRVENSVGKGENAGDHHFFLFPQCL